MNTSLLTEVLIQLVKEKRDNHEYGVIIINLPSFNYKRLVAELLQASNKSIEIFFLGFYSDEEAELRADIPEDNGFNLRFSVEEAEASRNSGDEECFRIMIIKRRDIEKLSSLLWFPEIDLNTIYKQSCKFAEDKLVNSNVMIRNLLKALKRKDIMALLNLERLLDYLQALLTFEADELPEAIKANLYRLGLCTDTKIDEGNPDIDEIKKRIKKNKDIVNRIGALEQAERKSISQYAAKNPGNAAVKAILQFYRCKDISILRELDLSSAEECLREVKRASKPGEKETKAKSTIKPTSLAAQLVFDDDEEEIDKLLEQMKEAVDNRQNKDKSEAVPLTTNAGKITIKTEPATEKIANDFVGRDKYGGIVFAEVSNPKDAIDSLSKYKFTAFDESYLSKAREYLSNFESHLRASEGYTEGECGKSILHYLTSFLGLRGEFADNAVRLQDAPMLQIIKEKAKYVKFLNAYADLLSVIREAFPAMWKLDPVASKEIINAIISLDVVYVIGSSNCHAIPTPMNPLYLWKYIKLAEEIVNSKNADGVQNAELVLSDEDKDFIIRKAEDIPDPLSVLLLSANIREQGSAFLPLSGRLGCVPVYSSIQQINQVESGIESLNKAIIRYLKLYPHAGLMLRLCLVNPPSIGIVVDMLKKLNRDKEFNIDGIELTVFRTKEASQDWVEIDDKSINEGFLSRMRGNLSGQFKLSIINKSLSYEKILKQIKREQHLLVVFDPNERRIDNAKNNPLIHVHPLCIPKVYECSPLSAEITIRPANEGGIFSDYTNIVERLNERPASFSTTSLFINTPIKESTYKELLHKADWLIILDQNLKTWDISLRSASEKLYYKSHDYREMGIYSLHSKKLVTGFYKLITGMGNFIPNEKGIQEIIAAIRAINDDGLLSIVSHATNSIFDERHGKGSVGLAVAAIAYKNKNPDAILVGLDTQFAREWLADRETGKLPDLIGIKLGDSNTAEIDIIEVKTHSGDYTLHGNCITGRAVEQVMVIEVLINEMLSANEKLTTTSRKEILRAQVFEGLLQNEKTAEQKHKQSLMLNELFAGRYRVEISRSIAHVDFDESSSHEAVYFSEASEGGKEIRLTVFGCDAIQEIISGDVAAGRLFHGQARVSSEPSSTVPVSDESQVAVETQERVVAPSTAITVEMGFEDAINPSLEETTRSSSNDDEVKTLINEKCKKLTKVLRDFQIQAAPVDEALVQQAARFIRFKVELRSGETIAKLEKYKSDIARELEAYGEILIENLKGTRFVSMDVPFKGSNKPLYLINHLSRLSNDASALSVLAGQTPDGSFECFDIANAPHILIAGTTGSGKTIFLYALIVSLINQYSSDELELLIIDPKQTDFIFFNSLPHLRYNEVLTDSEQALAALDEINTRDKEDRTRLLKENYSRDISSYNTKNSASKMKRLVVVIDEYADLVQAAETQGIRKDFEKNLCMLAQRVRNLGIHLVIATQRPNAAIVTSALKANIPFRISFRLPAHQDSMTILDRSGAQDLLGQGDMLMVTESNVIRLQGCFISEEQLIDYIKKYSKG